MNDDTTMHDPGTDPGTDIRGTVLAALAEIAPEIEGRRVDDDTNLLDELDLDSMDLVNLVAVLDDRLGIEIPERDYGELSTLGSAVAYLEARSPTRREEP